MDVANASRWVDLVEEPRHVEQQRKTLEMTLGGLTKAQDALRKWREGYDDSGVTRTWEWGFVRTRYRDVEQQPHSRLAMIAGTGGVPPSPHVE